MPPLGLKCMGLACDSRLHLPIDCSAIKQAAFAFINTLK